MGEIMIGLAGKKGHGKTTVANILCNVHGAVRFALGDAVKKVTNILFGTLPLDKMQELGDRGEREFWEEKIQVPAVSSALSSMYPRSPDGTWTQRKCVQNVGRILRTWMPQIWIDIVDRQIQAYRKLAGGADLIVVSDIRLHTEVAWLMAKGGHVWFVDNPRIPPSNDMDPTECEVELCGGFTHILNTDSLVEKVARELSIIRSRCGVKE